jgi:Chaperone of endosialidase
VPHMLAQEHMGFVDVLRYEPHTRTSATLAAALSAVGSTKAILVLSLTGDGVWALTSSVTIPTNVTLWVPANVTVNIAAAATLTIQGNVISFNQDWFLGSPGTVTYVPSPSDYHLEIAYLTGKGINFPVDGRPLILGTLPGGSGTGRQMIFTTNNAGMCSMHFLTGIQDVPHAWEMGIDALGHWLLRRENAVNTNLRVNDIGMSISNASNAGPIPAHVLHMIVDDAFKATASWTVPSDEQLKTVQRVATEGLAAALAYPAPVWFTWNGKGGTDPNAPEQLGFIAQDAIATAPYFFRTYEDKLDPADAAPTTLYSGNYSALPFILLNAVKDLAAQITALTTRVAALEAKVP